MNQNEFFEISNTAPPEYVAMASDFSGSDKTLLYGYTCEKKSWHIYKKDGLLHKLVYGYPAFFISYDARESFILSDLIPDKRVFPECTDFHLAKMFLAASIDVPYLPFDNNAHLRDSQLARTFYGLVREEVTGD